MATRGRRGGALREAVLAIALLALSVDFLQPLAHARLLREGGARAVAELWGASCLPDTGHRMEGGDVPAPPSALPHDCCLGLVHAPAAAPPSLVLVDPPPAPVEADPPPVEVVVASGIRDGPHQPRAPPVPV